MITESKKNILKIRLIRLLDINKDSEVKRHGYIHYGRFAVLRDNSFWFSEVQSSHPQDTQTGWYWAISPAGELLVSARGATPDGERLFADCKMMLALLIEELVRRRCISKPGGIERVE